MPPETEARLRAGLARRDAEAVRWLLADALAPTVEALLQPIADQLSGDEFEAVLDQLAGESARLAPEAPTLSGDAVSRAGIYEDHP